MKIEDVKQAIKDIQNGVSFGVKVCLNTDKAGQHVALQALRNELERLENKTCCWVFVSEECGNPLDGVDYNWGWKCSNCNLWWEYDDYRDDPEQEPNANYCPNCGAKMKEVTK